MEPLEIHALDEGFNIVAPNIPYTSLQWNRRYYECGDFTCVVPSNVYSPDWAYIYTSDRPETGVIQKVEYEDARHGDNDVDVVTLSGFFTEKWLNDYVFLVEETDTETVYIQKPPPVVAKRPEVFKDKDGKLYTKNIAGKYCTTTGQEVSLTDKDLTKVELGNVAGTQNYMGSDDYAYSSRFNYYKESDGKIHQINGRGDDTVINGTEVTEFNFSAQNKGAVYKDADGSYKWIPHLAENKDQTNRRKVEQWEERTKGLDKIYDSGGGTYAVMYREVKGAYQLRTEVGEVGKPCDNVKSILAWASRIFGDGITYDSADFTGVQKTIDTSLKRFGDLCFEELKTIGASARMFYSYENNSVVFQLWRGLDRTQDQAEPQASTYSLGKAQNKTFPDGFEELEYIESTGTQYIDTGFIPNQNTGIELECIHTAKCLCATDLSGDGDGLSIWANSAKCGKSKSSGVSFITTEKVKLEEHGGVFKKDGVVVWSAPSATFACNNSLAIFALKRGGVFSSLGQTKLYSFKLFDNGTLKLNLVPCRRLSDNAIGLVDRLTGGFYGNKGTGVFKAGAVVPQPEPEPEPEPEKPRKNPFVVFSDTWGNLNGFKVSRDTSNYKNKCYVLFEYDEPSKYDADGSPMCVWYKDWGSSDSPLDQPSQDSAARHIPYKTHRGYDVVRLDDGLPDSETYLDLRSDKPEFDQDWKREELDEGSWNEMLKLDGLNKKYEQWRDHYAEEGRKALANDYGVIDTVDTGTFSTYRYLDDYDLGDKVDIAIETIGFYQTARIIEVSEVYESGKSDIVLTMGEQQITESKKARLV